MTSFDPIEWFKLAEGELESSLADRGYARTKHEHHPQMAGTIYTVFEGRSGLVRWIYDGRQDAFILRAYKPSSRLAGVFKSIFMASLDLDKLKDELIVRSGDARQLPSAEELAAKARDFVLKNIKPIR